MKYTTTKEHFILTKHPHRVAIERKSKRITKKDKEILADKLAETINLRNAGVKHRCHNLGED